MLSGNLHIVLLALRFSRLVELAESEGPHSSTSPCVSRLFSIYISGHSFGAIIARLGRLAKLQGAAAAGRSPEGSVSILELKCCQIADNKLVLPSDVRSMFLPCPVSDPKWRELLFSFYKQWAAPVGELRPNQSPIKHPLQNRDQDR